MAYVDHAFSLTEEEDRMIDNSYAINKKPPIKEISLAVSLFFFGVVAIILGFFMSAYRVGGDTAHGLFFAILGAILFLPGIYFTKIAYYAYKGYKGLVTSNLEQ